MRTSASRENAGRRLTALCRTVARLRARDLAKLLGGVAAVLFFLELVYLAAGNLVLKSQLVQKAVGSAHGFHLQFASAYTLWPGHVHVNDLALRFEDYNVQFELVLATADLDVALGQLPFKKFRVTKLEAQGTRFRLRHKLITVGPDAERVAAYPPIAGFADPPYFVGVRRPPTPPEDYDLWQVRVENVHALVSELWVMEYRFRGRGLAKGSFVVQPERWVQVEPASLALGSGTLTLGEHLVAADVRGRIACSIPDMYVQATEGLEVLREILATVDVELVAGHLDFLQAYLARLGSARYAGDADIRLVVNVARGVVQPKSRVTLHARPFRLSYRGFELGGDGTLSLARSDATEDLVLALGAPRLVASRAGSPEPPPTVEGLGGSLKIRSADLKRDLSLGAARAAVRSIRVPALGWFATKDTTLAGSGEASFELARDDARAVSGGARLQVAGAHYARGDFAASSDVRGELDFRRDGDASALELRRATLRLDGARLQTGQKQSKPFTATVDGSGLRVEPDSGAEARGILRLRVSSTEALLPLILSNPLRSVASTALDLEQLSARAAVRIARDALDVQVVEAQSGNVFLKGYLSKREKRPRGAFLLSSGPFNVGVTLSDGETEVSPFVSDDWLASAWPRIARAPNPG